MIYFLFLQEQIKDIIITAGDIMVPGRLRRYDEPATSWDRAGSGCPAGQPEPEAGQPEPGAAA